MKGVCSDETNQLPALVLGGSVEAAQQKECIHGKRYGGGKFPGMKISGRWGENYGRNADQCRSIGRANEGVNSNEWLDRGGTADSKGGEVGG